MIEDAKNVGDYLIVIVNNDEQQRIKKGKIIFDQDNRLRLINALKYVDEVVLAIDNELPVIETIRQIANHYPDDELIFANGGDRNSNEVIPETDVCQEYGIRMVNGVGGKHKADSSTRINQALGHQD